MNSIHIRSADWQSAVSPIGNRQRVGQSQRARTHGRPAGCHPATQQIAKLRYDAGPARPIELLSYAGSGHRRKAPEPSNSRSFPGGDLGFPSSSESQARTPRNRLAQLVVAMAFLFLARFACDADAADRRTGVEEALGDRSTTSVAGKTYEYDPENRLIGVDGGQVQMAYDGDGHRVSKTVATAGGGSKTTYYLVDDLNPTGYPQVLEEWEATGTEPPRLVRNYTHGLNLISARDSSESYPEPTTHYYGYDGHGSVRFLTGETGPTVTDTYTYDAYGVLLDQTPADANARTPNNYLYAGEQWNPDLDLYYNRARYLDPNLGRFWTMDTFEGNPSDPLSLHKFLYADANPVDRIDPSGNLSTPEMAVVDAGIGTIARTGAGAGVAVGRRYAINKLIESVAVTSLLVLSTVDVGEIQDGDKGLETSIQSLQRRLREPSYLFLHATSVGLWPMLTAATEANPPQIDVSKGRGDFGIGFYTTRIGDERSVFTAAEWARKCSSGRGGLVSIWSIPTREYEPLSKLHIGVPPLSKGAYSRWVQNFRKNDPALSGRDVVYGDIAERGPGNRWVPNDELSQQYKFESRRTVGKLHFLSVVPLP